MCTARGMEHGFRLLPSSGAKSPWKAMLTPTKHTAVDSNNYRPGCRGNSTDSSPGSTFKAYDVHAAEDGCNETHRIILGLGNTAINSDVRTASARRSAKSQVHLKTEPVGFGPVTNSASAPQSDFPAEC
jgi:hypothetical protein